MLEKNAAIQQQKSEEERIGDSMSFLQDRDEDENQRREINIRTKQALDQQLKLKKEHQAALLAQRKREEEGQLKQLARLEEKSKQAHKEQLEKAKKEGDDMYQAMLQRSKSREDRKKLESERDLILLQHALEKERNEIALEKPRKKKARKLHLNMCSAYELNSRTKQQRGNRQMQFVMRHLKRYLERMTRG